MVCYLIAVGLGAAGFLLGLLVGRMVIKRPTPTARKMMTRYMPGSTTEIQMNGSKCTCHACIEAYKITWFGRPLNHCQMILCNLCGNKRCPHAFDHTLECTNSNEPGQLGAR